LVAPIVNGYFVVATESALATYDLYYSAQEQ
jgi:hypothetical protein